MIIMQADVLSLEGKKMKSVDLPKVFESEYDAGIVKRAVLSSLSARMQAFGTYPYAGRETTAIYRGSRLLPAEQRTINIDRSRKPRAKNARALYAAPVRGIAGVIKGPKAHPPKAGKNLHEKINKKERRKAVESAIAGSLRKELLAKRGHKISDGINLPIVVENKIEELKKTREVSAALKALKLWGEIERAKKKSIRAGKGHNRGRKYNKKKSILIVVGKNSGIHRAARNLAGVDVVESKNLSAELLAPGGEAGRLVVWSENALEKIGENSRGREKAGKGGKK